MFSQNTSVKSDVWFTSTFNSVQLNARVGLIPCFILWTLMKFSKACSWHQLVFMGYTYTSLLDQR